MLSLNSCKSALMLQVIFNLSCVIHQALCIKTYNSKWKQNLFMLPIELSHIYNYDFDPYLTINSHAIINCITKV